MCEHCNEGPAKFRDAGVLDSEEALAAFRKKLTGQAVSARRPLDSFLDELHAEISNLDDRLAALIGRLAPVLGPAYPEPCDPESAQDSPDESVVASILRARIEYVQRLQQDVRVVLDRLEL